jgi:glycosyltransferase involved in cell wall biosynthesis
MGYSHQFDDVLKIAEQMVCESGVRFVFVGDGVRRQSVEQAVRERELTNVTFRPFQPEDVLAETLSAIDIHIITLREEFAGLVVPSKIYGVLAAGRPVVYSGPEESEVAEFVREWSVGYVVAAGDQDALRRAIEALVRDEGLRRELGRRGREVAEAQCGKDVSVERYMRALSLRE